MLRIFGVQIIAKFKSFLIRRNHKYEETTTLDSPLDPKFLIKLSLLTFKAAASKTNIQTY